MRMKKVCLYAGLLCFISNMLVLVQGPALANAAPPEHNISKSPVARPTVMRTGPQKSGVTTYGSVSGNTCYAYPPNNYDPGLLTGNSDNAGGADPNGPSAPAGSYFDLFGTGGTQDSTFLSGSDQGASDQSVGYRTAPQDFPPGSTVSIYNPWSYDGVLKVQGDSGYFGSSSASAGMTMNLIFQNNGSNSVYQLGTHTLSSANLLGGKAEVWDAGNKTITTAVVPNTKEVTIYDGIELHIWGSDQTTYLSNAYGYAIFEGTSSDNGVPLGAFDGKAVKWAYNLPPTWAISSC